MNARQKALIRTVVKDIGEAENAFHENDQRTWLQDAEAALKRVIATLPATGRKAL